MEINVLSLGQFSITQVSEPLPIPNTHTHTHTHTHTYDFKWPEFYIPSYIPAQNYVTLLFLRVTP
jgi:hypothetical protein